MNFIAFSSLEKGFSEQIMLAMSPNKSACFILGSLSQAVLSFLQILNCPPRPTKLNKSSDFKTKYPNKKAQVKFVHFYRAASRSLPVIIALRGLAIYA